MSKLFYGAWPTDKVGNPLKVKVIKPAKVSAVTGKPITPKKQGRKSPGQSVA